MATNSVDREQRNKTAQREDEIISLADADDMGVDDDALFQLPETTVSIDQKTGLKTIVSYSIKPDGSKCRSTKTVRVHKVKKTVTAEMLQRKQWQRFGDAARYKKGDESMTAVSLEEIFLERARTQPKSELEKANDPLKAMASSQTSLLVCRICGKKGDHWTTKCPYKDLAAMGDKTSAMMDVGGPGDAKSGGGYVPPSRRAGATGASEGDSMNKRREENSLRVSNLSEDTREQDLQELFRPFGPVTRIYVAFNRETGESRGFAFVNFVNRDDGQRAIDRLDGFGYDNLILRVEWSAPREGNK
jgi:translation initiation factor 3 subunit G